MKNRLEIYILLGVITVLSIYIILREDQNLNYTTPKFSILDRNEITKITFDNIEITNTNKVWYLSSGYQVSESSIKRITAELASLKVIDKISDTEDYKRFGLDNVIILQVFKNDKMEINIQIGSTSSTGNYTYVKFPDEKGIFSIRGDIKALFGNGEDDLRSKRILTASNIEEVSINKSDAKISKSGEDLKDLQFLSSLEADSFKELPRDETLLTLSINGEGYNKSLIIYKEVEGKYPATSSDVDFPFTLPEYIVNKIIGIK